MRLYSADLTEDLMRQNEEEYGDPYGGPLSLSPEERELRMRELTGASQTSPPALGPSSLNESTTATGGTYTSQANNINAIASKELSNTHTRRESLGTQAELAERAAAMAMSGNEGVNGGDEDTIANAQKMRRLRYVNT